MTDSSSLDRLASALAGARRVTVLTGAGVSAASGVPTFRGADGLWRKHRPEELASPEAFASDPRLVWEWYDWRRAKIAACSPNRAHEVLAAWQDRFPAWRLITQNIDGLHERAGSRDVIRFHGSIWEVRCRDRCAASPATWIDETVPMPELPPPCPHCEGIIRPSVVWFGETIPADAIERSIETLACDVFLTVGTSSVVYPAAALVGAARNAGAFSGEINLDPTPMSGLLDVSIQGPAERVLDDLDRLLNPRT